MMKDESSSNSKGPKSGRARGNGRTGKVFDLEERTAIFGENSIKFAKKIPVNRVTFEIIPQFVDASTSIGSNYSEAHDAQSKKDFRHKICICKKESRETKYWLRMIVAAEQELRDQAAVLWQEANELNLIFGAIILSCDGKRKKPEE